MDKKLFIDKLRRKLKNNETSIGAWQQIGSSEISEILSSSNVDWVAIDMEHGCISNSNLPNLFRAIELNNKLPFVRIQEKSSKAVKDALEAGAAGLIIPMIENKDELEDLISLSNLPPNGRRGIGFCRANQYGINFKNYIKNPFRPFIVPMIENIEGLRNIDAITKVFNVDAILIGPYDLSASLNCCGEFDNSNFVKSVDIIKKTAKGNNIASGIHIIEPVKERISEEINKGHQLIAFSLDTVMLQTLMVN